MADAELYVAKLKRKGVAPAYFGDWYKVDGLFPMINVNTGSSLSWWDLAGRSELFNKSGNLTVAGAKTWRAELRPQIKAFLDKETLFWPRWDYDRLCHVLTERQLTAAEVERYKDWAKRLLWLLDTAIRLKSTVIWST